MKLLKPMRMILLTFWIIGIAYSSASAVPLISIPNQEVFAGEKVIFSIELSNSDVSIDGYSFKLEYDDTILMNPTVISEDTISEGNATIMADPSKDGVGKYTVAVFSGLNTSENGTLIKVQFDVASSASNSYPLTLESKNVKTVLFQSGFTPVESEFTDGLLLIKTDTTLPTVSMPLEIKAAAGETIIVPFMIKHIDDTIDGFSFKLDYDDSMLLNPEVISENTLSQGNANIMKGPSSDGIGKYTVAVFNGLNAKEEGTLINLQFDIAADAECEIPITFQKKNEKTIIFAGGFENITAEWQDGKVVISIVDTRPTISVASDIHVPDCQTSVIVPINITNIPENNIIEGYSLKLDYDDVLTNPQVITEGTLTEGNKDIFFGFSEDSIGKYTVAVFSGLKASQDGVLVKVKFDINSQFIYPKQASVSLQSKNEKTSIFSAGFNKVPATFTDGMITGSTCKPSHNVLIPVSFDDGNLFSGDVIVDIYRSTSSQLYTSNVFTVDSQKQYTIAIQLPNDHYDVQLYATNNQANATMMTIAVSDEDIVTKEQTIITESGAGAAIDLDIETLNYDAWISLTDIETSRMIESNTEFFLAVAGQNATNLDTVTIDLLFDSDKIRFIKGFEDNIMAGITNLLKQNGGSTLGFQVVETESGIINITNSLIHSNESEAPEGSGILALIQFEVLNANEPASFTLANVIFSNNAQQEEHISLLTNAQINDCLTWDINCDCSINYKDLQILGDHWLCRESQPCWDPDVNISPVPEPGTDTQIINVWDLKILGDHWLEKCSENIGQ